MYIQASQVQKLKEKAHTRNDNNRYARRRVDLAAHTQRARVNAREFRARARISGRPSA